MDSYAYVFSYGEVFQIKFNSLLSLSVLPFVLALGITGCQIQPSTDSSETVDEEESNDTMQNSGVKKGDEHLTVGDSVGDLLTHPAFQGFENQLMPRNDSSYDEEMLLRDIGRLMPYHNHVDPETVVNSLNHMVDEIDAGNKIFYDFYSAEQKQEDQSRTNTGLFFFRGDPGAPFAIISPGGGFSYVGSLHEGFPYAQELSNRGYNAFVLNYRVGGEDIATEDLSAAISYIVENAEELEVSVEDYSVWGSSAGARMAANAGSFKKDGFIAPNTIVMAYTAHQNFSENDPPTFVTASKSDRIVNVDAVKNRVANLRNAGIDVEYLQFDNVGHGFGLGTGTDAEGWIDEAISFWEKQMKAS